MRARGTNSAENHWQGRIAIKVLSNPPQSFSSNFELDGQGDTGRLTLLSPLGTTVAQMHWAPGLAQLRQGGEVRDFASLDDLAQQATGTALPVAALFDWLHGTPTPAPGWEVALDQLPEGRLQAHRQADASAAVELRILLER
ncbi:outer membrane lipoprotein LolB [uncultured Rhodoferax sp.]|uniref:outer membrane lipoprotein LolB n=1 Tax=uncultured Rhodoferax sp. TaxID=223188 RepID=UPI0025FDF35C|nr:outer membrane lipoprotein LolB [uncultured Rhodoferax sp.]